MQPEKAANKPSKVAVDASTSTSRIYGYIVLLGIGTGSYLLAGVAVVQAKVPASEVNNAVGFMTLGVYPANIVSDKQSNAPRY